MNTYFVRHTKKFDIDENTRNRIWDGNLVAIHFPWTKESIHEQGEDSRSMNPDDYDTSGKKALNALRRLSAEGGYVCAVYDQHEGCKVGWIEPNTEILLIEGKWGARNGNDGRTALLKTLRMSKCITLQPIQALSLLVAQPRQGTLCQWSRIGKRVENIVESRVSMPVLDDLTPDLQEVMCAEFLRSEAVEKFGLPRLSAFLLPVGRTMKDIDVLGINEQGDVIAAQVTYAALEQVTEKVERLKNYLVEQSNIRPILFCDVQTSQHDGPIHIFSIREVFDVFCHHTPIGKKWLSSVMGAGV